MEIKTRFWRKRRKSSTSGVSEVPQTRSQAKRRKISTSDIPPTIQIRSSVTGMLRDFKIILPKLNLDKYKSDSMMTNCSNDERESASMVLMEPRLSIPRVEIAPHVDGNSRFENIHVGGTLSRKENMINTSLADGVREHKLVDTNNTMLIHKEPHRTPKAEHSDLIIEERKSSKFNIVNGDSIQQILRDVKNVEANVASSRKPGKEEAAFLSLLRGQENIFLKKSKRVRELIDYEMPLSNRLPQKRCEAANTKQFYELKRVTAKMNVPHCQSIKEEPTETSKTGKLVNYSFTENEKNVEVQKARIVAVRSSRLRFNRNVPHCQFIKKDPTETSKTRKLVNFSLTENEKNVEIQKCRTVAVRSSRLRFNRNVPHCQFIREEPAETSKTGKLVNFSVTEDEKNVEVQRPRTVAVRSSRLRFNRNNETELTRELSVENVKNVSSPQVDQPEQNSPRRKRIRNMAHVTNTKNLRSSKITFVKFNNGSEPQLISSQLKTSQKIEEKRNYNDFLKFDSGSKNPFISRQSESSLKSKKKRKLNVSFKEEIDIIDERPVESSFRRTMPINIKTPTTSTPCTFGKIVPSGRQDESTEVPFYGFPSSVDLSPHVGFCSFVLKSVSSYLKEKSKKRMTKKEASEKTKIVNFCRKTLKNIQRPKKSSQRLAMRRMKENLAAKSIAVEYECQKMPTSYVRLNRLNETDISSYKMTPLREERTPLKSKTKYDYGIDDVNTDDSTDDEDDPKKIVPNWALQAKKNLKIFNPHEKIARKTIHLWMKPPQLNEVALRRLIFGKCKIR